MMTDGKGLREAWHSKELWKSVEKATGEGGRNAYAIRGVVRDRRMLRPLLTSIPL